MSRRRPTVRFVALKVAVLIGWGCTSNAAPPGTTAPTADPAWSGGRFSVTAWNVEGQLVEVRSGSGLVTNLGARSRESDLDASHRWLSSTEASSTAATGRTLVVGRAGGELDVFALDVVGARWHRTRPDLLAVQQRRPDGVSVIRIADFGELPPTLGDPVDIGVFGTLGVYDTWGFALDLGGPTERSHLIGPQGSVIVGEIDGSVVTTLDGQPLVTGPRAVTRLVEPSTGTASAVDWIETRAWIVAAASAPERAAFLVTVDGTATDIVVLDGDRTVRAAGGGWLVALTWEQDALVTLRVQGRQFVAERWRLAEDLEPSVIGAVTGLDATTAAIVDFARLPDD